MTGSPNWMGSKPIGSMYGIFTYIWMIFGVYVGKYSSTMDPMGKAYHTKMDDDWGYPWLALF